LDFGGWDSNNPFYKITFLYTVATESLGTRERTLCKKAIFAAFPKIEFLTGDIEFFFRSSHGGGLLPDFFLDLYC
jgi:hypothetical protein